MYCFRFSDGYGQKESYNQKSHRSSLIHRLRPVQTMPGILKFSWTYSYIMKQLRIFCHPCLPLKHIHLLLCQALLPPGYWEIWDSLYIFIIIFIIFLIIWRLITLQYCSGFCHTLTWISHGYTCTPHPDPPSHPPLHPIALGLPSTPGSSTCPMHPTWAGDLLHPR